MQAGNRQREELDSRKSSPIIYGTTTLNPMMHMIFSSLGLATRTLALLI